VKNGNLVDTRDKTALKIVGLEKIIKFQNESAVGFKTDGELGCALAHGQVLQGNINVRINQMKDLHGHFCRDSSAKYQHCTYS
jgi:hypothetical protein